MSVLTVTATAADGRKVKMTATQASSIETLNNTRKGGCGSVTGYTPNAQGWEVVPTLNIQLITHFSTMRLYERRKAALEAVEFGDLKFLASDDVLGNMTIADLVPLFNERKQKLIDSLQTTLDGVRDDEHRKAHDRCYAYIGDVKVHLETTDGIKDNGKKGKVPVENADGSFNVESIMIPYLELSRTETVKGRRKEKKSGAGVLMENMIKGCLNKRSHQIKTLSLKVDNFETFKVDRQTFLPEDVATFGDLLEEAA